MLPVVQIKGIESTKENIWHGLFVPDFPPVFFTLLFFLQIFFVVTPVWNIPHLTTKTNVWGTKS